MLYCDEISLNNHLQICISVSFYTFIYRYQHPRKERVCVERHTCPCTHRASVRPYGGAYRSRRAPVGTVRCPLARTGRPGTAPGTMSRRTRPRARVCVRVCVCLCLCVRALARAGRSSRRMRLHESACASVCVCACVRACVPSETSTDFVCLRFVCFASRAIVVQSVGCLRQRATRRTPRVLRGGTPRVLTGVLRGEDSAAYSHG
jgi:hypothetical protein